MLVFSGKYCASFSHPLLFQFPNLLPFLSHGWHSMSSTVTKLILLLLLNNSKLQRVLCYRKATEQSSNIYYFDSLEAASLSAVPPTTPLGTNLPYFLNFLLNDLFLLNAPSTGLPSFTAPLIASTNAATSVA